MALLADSRSLIERTWFDLAATRGSVDTRARPWSDGFMIATEEEFCGVCRTDETSRLSQCHVWTAPGIVLSLMFHGRGWTSLKSLRNA